MLTKYHHLPTLKPNEAPLLPWMRLDHIRQQMGERIKAAYFAKVVRVAKRLNLIEPSLRPNEVNIAIQQLTRAINPFENRPTPITVDRFGRAVGVGKRKASTARAFVVEGTGDFLVNGKPLSEIFGRVHDRESAAWALMATQRIDKYNVWALVRGGGTTGQAEALTLAVAKALLAHEPALKPALRKGMFMMRHSLIRSGPDHGANHSQLVVLQETTGRWRERSTVVSRLVRARPGSSDNRLINRSSGSHQRLRVHGRRSPSCTSFIFRHPRTQQHPLRHCTFCTILNHLAIHVIIQSQFCIALSIFWDI